MRRTLPNTRHKRKVDAGQCVHLVDMYNAVPPADLADGVHPNASGYAKMAAEWFDALQSVPGSLTDDPPSDSPPPTGACTATYEIVNQWTGGFQAGVTVDAGTATLDGWTVEWAFPGGQTIAQLRNGVSSIDGAYVSVRTVAYNGSVPAGGSATFGFIGTSSGSNPPPTELTCTSP